MTIADDVKDYWDNALTMLGKTKLLQSHELHANLCTRKWDDLPKLVQEKIRCYRRVGWENEK